jgi:hypothetical protein
MGIERAMLEAGSTLMASGLSRELKMKKCGSMLMRNGFSYVSVSHSKAYHITKISLKLSSIKWKTGIMTGTQNPFPLLRSHTCHFINYELIPWYSVIF